MGARALLPEHTHYADTGCDISPSCLRCPLPKCRYDEPWHCSPIDADDHARRINELREIGMAYRTISEHTGIPERTIYKLKKKGLVS